MTDGHEPRRASTRPPRLDHLDCWQIFHRPLDYPNVPFVVRRFEIRANKVTPTDEIYLANTLDLARRCIPPGCARFLPSDDDDPCIVETWM